MTSPLVPIEVDLQDFSYMPLDVRRLRDSDLAALESPEACWAAVLLWAASWHQVPAASLPDDDRVLANLAGYGRVVKEWKRVRDGALRGWIKCDDGRLYHPVVAEKALEAWNSKMLHSYGKLKERLRKAHKNDAVFPTFIEWMESGNPADWPQDSAGIPPETPKPSGGKVESSAGIPPENALKGEGKGEVNLKTVHSTEGDTYSTGVTPAGLVCARLKSECRIPSVNPQHPKLLALLAAGMTADELVSAGMDANGKGFAWVLAAAEGRRRDAAAVATMPNARASPRISHSDASKLAAARAIFGTEIEGENRGSSERIIDATPVARLVGG